MLSTAKGPNPRQLDDMQTAQKPGKAAPMTPADRRNSDPASTFEAFFQVWLDIHGVFGLSQDFQKVITGQEVEARELLALVFQIVF